MSTGVNNVGCPRGHQFKLYVDPNDKATRWLEVVASPTPACKAGQRFRVPAETSFA